MNANEKNMAGLRGEVMAANLLSSLAIQTGLMLVPTQNRDAVFERMTAFIDETQNMSGPAKGDAQDEFNTFMRETARYQAMQALEGIARMFRNPPTQGQTSK